MAINHEGTQAVSLLKVMIRDINDVQTVQLIGHTGEENNPPVGSMVAVIAEGEAFKIAISTADAIIPDLAVGGKRCYATTSDGTAMMAEMRLDPDGRVTLHNGEASLVMTPEGVITSSNDGVTFTMQPDGTTSLVNGASSITMSPAGVITFHGTAANFDCPVTAPSYGATTVGGGTGAITCTEVTANGKTLTGHVHNETGTTTGVAI